MGDGLKKELAQRTKRATHEKALPLRATPQISALLAFERTASLMSFSRAARELAVTPSAISHQIRSLEQYFSTQLFVRGGKTVSLTEQGESFANEVRAGLAQLDLASRNLLLRGRSSRDQLRIGVSPDLAHLFFLEALSEFEHKYPQLKVSLDIGAGAQGGNSDSPLIVLQIGKADLSSLRLQPIMDISAVPVCARKLAIADINDPDELLRHRLIHTRSDPTAWRDWFFSAESDWNEEGAIWVDGAAAALQAAEAGLGIALAPWPLITSTNQFHDLVFGSAKGAAHKQTIYMACRPEQKDDRRVVAFSAWLTDHLARRVAVVGDSSPQGKPLAVLASAH